jgi:HEXXH motif-containing protein
MDGPRGGEAINGIDPAPGRAPGGAKSLSLRVARLAFHRLRRARRSPDASPRVAIARLAAVLRTLPEETRTRILTGPDVRGFLSEVETWLEVRRLALSPAAKHRPVRLFDLVSRTQYLTALVPRGRIDAAFPGRCLRFARLRLEDATFDLAALVLGLRLLHPQPGTLRVPLRFREDPEQGRPGDRIDLGTFASPAGPLAVSLTGWRRARRSRRSMPLVHAALRGATLTLTARGAGSLVAPAAGSLLIVPDLEPGRHASRGPGRGMALRLVRREMIPGTSIVIAPVVQSTPRRLRVTREAPDLGRRLARAIRILQVAWPEARREVERRTFMVVPIREAGTVSYSMAARPGISFINVFRKSIVDLADDLLHETAHHRLHDLQETVTLMPSGPEALEVQAFDSPWRGTRRPLHGVLHGAYTFLFRAELFQRVLRVARRRPRTLGPELGSSGLAFVVRELRREKRMISRALRDLKTASRSGLLTPAGRRLLRDMRAWLRRLERG